MRSRTGVVLVWLALAAGLFAGCGDGSDGGGTTAPATTTGEGRAPDGDPLIGWHTFGRIPERTHYLATDRGELDPPLREAWSINTHGLIEFPPAVAHETAYVVNKFGNLAAVRLRDHAKVWERARDPKNRGKPTDVTAPVYHEGRLYIAFLDGELLALDAEDGKTVWKRQLPGHLESSPMATEGRLYIGSDSTDLYALDASSGKVIWHFNTPGAIKASPSVHDNRVFVADYQGVMFALTTEGKPVWRTNTTEVRPFGRGGFYSSPAIAFGHAYAARDDGTVYAFDERTGKIDWFFQTHDAIYGSPAAAQVPGTPPSIYIGSYDEHFYALNARNGKVRWKYDIKGPVPGTATVIGHTVYTSSFQTRDSVGLDVEDGRRTFELDDAGYTPVVSDGEKLYLIGYYKLIGLEPK